MKYTDSKYRDVVLQFVGEYCGKPVTNYTEDTFHAPLTWSFYHALFFSFTVCSTVGTMSQNFPIFIDKILLIDFPNELTGYGNISPSSTSSRVFMIFYALIGIPMNGFLFAYLGDFFGKVVRISYSALDQETNYY